MNVLDVVQAHRLELAINDALKEISFDLVDEMLHCLYYFYSKSLKKCRELEGIVSDLWDCFQFDDDDIRPLSVSGSRLVCHKLNAMLQVLMPIHLTWLQYLKTLQ